MLVLLVGALLMLSEPERLSARLQVESGSALMGQGLLIQAREAFSRALDINPHEHHAVLGLARVAALEGCVDLASNWYRIFIERCPGDPRAPLELGLILLEIPDSLSRAGTLIRTACSIDPAAADSRFALARLLLAEGNLAECMDMLRPLVDREGATGLEAGMMLANLLYRSGDVSGARAILGEGRFLSHAPAVWITARIFLSQGDYLRAADRATLCLELNPPRELADSAATLLDSLAVKGL